MRPLTKSISEIVVLLRDSAVPLMNLCMKKGNNPFQLLSPYQTDPSCLL